MEAQFIILYSSGAFNQRATNTRRWFVLNFTNDVVPAGFQHYNYQTLSE
jgi:hypothetical protein